MSYLLIGQDCLSKDIRLEKIKAELSFSSFEQFNFESFSGRELELFQLQEALLRLPLAAKKRLILIRAAEKLKEPVKGYLADYLKKPLPHVLLVLDANQIEKKDLFFRQIAKYVKVFVSKEQDTPDAFRLAQEIDRKRTAMGLKTLNQLFLNGEKPERIIGGLRYSWQKGFLPEEERRRRLMLLLQCDVEIKTGRLKPAMALEKLVVNLCCFSPSSSRV